MVLSNGGSTLVAHESDVNLTLNILPLLGRTQRLQQCVERSFIRRRVLEPCEEIERLVFREIPSVVKPSRQCRKILEPDSGVRGLRFKDVLALGLCE
jgi:hypothetical protein